MASKEHKIGELIANSVEDHFFNPAALARYLSEQPYYTLDRVMEIVLWIIEKQARRHEKEIKGGQTTESLALAYKLDKLIDQINKANNFENIKFPPISK